MVMIEIRVRHWYPWLFDLELSFRAMDWSTDQLVLVFFDRIKFVCKNGV